MANETLAILSFFSGAGGLDWGFRHQGFRVILALDHFPAAVNTYNFNARRRTARIADISCLTTPELEWMMKQCAPGVRPCGVVGGPPCQGFSRGNARADPNDPRNLLPFKYADLLHALNNKYALDFFVFENVMGLANPRHARRFKGIKKTFERAGFRIFLKELNAHCFGVAQNRPRLFVVGLNARLYPAAAFHFPTGDSRRVTVRQAIGSLPKPAYFFRGIRTCDIPHHPNHWTMMPKSAKLIHSQPNSDGRSFRKLVWDEECPTIAYGNREIHVHPNGGRRLSVHEALLLQGFPGTYRLQGNFSEQITQVSNAVPPPVASALAKAIRAVVVSRRSTTSRRAPCSDGVRP
jgi:DNA (cytosine-5)-methyltransferase 1